MSATSDRTSPRRRRRRHFVAPREDDPRVLRSRAAIVDAARQLFLSNGYAAATIDEIAAVAGVTKRTVYNHYPDKEALFVQIVEEMIEYAASFARELDEEFRTRITAAGLGGALVDMGCRLALAIVRSEVIALRRLLIGEARNLPALASDYYARVPGEVVAALASGFEHLDAEGLLRVTDPHRAAAQFAYLVAGETLDRALLVGRIPEKHALVACARDGVETFLARYLPP